jgi:hypothetical protein
MSGVAGSHPMYEVLFQPPLDERLAVASNGCDRLRFKPA